MTRTGRGSPAAALIYAHTSQVADRAIPEALDVRVIARRRSLSTPGGRLISGQSEGDRRSVEGLGPRTFATPKPTEDQKST